MTAPVVVIGTGGMGREALAWLRDADPGREVLGFLDDDAGTHGAIVAGLPVLGDVSWLAANVADAVIAIGDGRARARIDATVQASGRTPVTVVHPTAVVGPGTTIGPGSILAPSTVVTTDVAIGRGVIVNYASAVGHDCRIDDHAFVGPGVTLAGFVSVGRAAEIGIGASVRQQVTIGAFARVGGGAMVVADVPAETLVIGVPARPVPGHAGAGRAAHS